MLECVGLLCFVAVRVMCCYVLFALFVICVLVLLRVVLRWCVFGVVVLL